MNDAEDKLPEENEGTSGQASETLLVVDGHSLAFRAYFGLPADNFTTSEGQPTNAVWGFATMLERVINAEKPDHIAVAFDMPGGTFRNEMLPQYKGTRDAAPEDLLSQLPVIQRMLQALGVKYIEMKGYEGDDIIGTLAKMGEDAGFRTLVLSGDRDAFQLIDENVTVLYPGHHFKDLKHMTPQAIEDKYHVTPQQYPDLAAMRGETADNIPGVPGVGDGFAAKWINQFGSLEGVLEHADEISGKKGEALRENIDQVRLNRKINTVLRDLDLGVKMKDLVLGNPDLEAVDKIFTELEFGVRTKNKILKAFNGGVVPQMRADEVKEAAAEPKIADVHITDIASGDELRDWVGKHVVASFGDGDDSDHGDSMRDAGAVELDERTLVESRGRREPIGPTAQCGKDVSHSWVFLASGGSKPGQAKLDSVTLLVGDEAAVINTSLVSGTDVESKDQTSSVAYELQALIDRYHASMVVYGYKEQLHMLGAAGLQMASPLFDVKLAGYLVHPDFHAEGIENAATHFLKVDIAESSQHVQGELDFGNAAGADGVEEVGKSVLCGRQAATVAALAAYLAPLIDERRQFGLLRSIELPVSRVLYGIENAGARVDIERLTTLLDQFTAEADQAQNIAFEAAGHKVNLQSPKQLRQVLFDEMGLKPSRRTKSGSYTTNAATLQGLYVKYANNQQASDFLGALLQHRETNKLKQIVQTLLDSVNQRDIRIHTTFEQTVAATGRLSSVDPNLQNIPNRNANGREIRSAFVPGPGYESLLSCDYSQVELRIMADLSGDEALIDAFKSGTDFHKYVASLVYGLPIDQISSDQRSHVKAMSYGLAYGLSTYGLSQQLKISPAEADVLKDKYFATFGKVHDYLESLVATARQKGYTETLFGRRRYFRDLQSNNRVLRDAAERGALNAPIQGTAADIMKIAMIRTDHALRQAGLASRVILQIHDELVLEIAPGESQQAGELVRQAMEHAVDLAVPLDVSIGEGVNWQDAAH
jgi:DNA polymerase I